MSPTESEKGNFWLQLLLWSIPIIWAGKYYSVEKIVALASHCKVLILQPDQLTIAKKFSI